MYRMTRDKRFAHLTKDVRFRELPRHERKVKIDSRFQEMFTDEKFRLNYTVDKRGRPTNHSTKEDLKRFYELSSSSSSSEDDDDDSDNEEEAERNRKKNVARRKNIEDASTSEQKEDDDDDDNDDSSVDLARGKGMIESSSDDDSSDTEPEEETIHPWGELDVNAEIITEPTSRLAVCHLDWDNIKAKDIYVLLNSFVPAGGIIKSVKIYLSDFGRERLAYEDVNGPEELKTSGKKISYMYNEKAEKEREMTEEVTEGEGFQSEKVREYELSRLRYYYAIVECDVVDTANKIIMECDGLEYESSGTKLDIRFVPEDMEFNDQPTDAVSGGIDSTVYRPKFFRTGALHYSSVKLSWDETDAQRKDLIQRAFEEDGKDQLDMAAYLASSEDDSDEKPKKSIDTKDISSSDEDENNASEDNRISKYKALLLNLDDEERKKKDEEETLEITWNSGFGMKKKVEKKDKEKNRDKKKVQVSKDKNGNDEEKAFSDDELPEDLGFNDPFFLDRGEDKKIKTDSKKPLKGGNKRKKSKVDDDDDDDGFPIEMDPKEKGELELLMMDEDDNKHHFDLRTLTKEAQEKKKKKKKRGIGREDDNSDEDEKDWKVDNFQMNVKDPRFSAVFTSHLYNIDPSDHKYKKTKGMEALIREKQEMLAKGLRIMDSGSSVSAANRQNNGLEGTSSSFNPPNDNIDLSVLVKSVKNKSAQFNKKKRPNR